MKRNTAQRGLQQEGCRLDCTKDSPAPLPLPSWLDTAGADPRCSSPRAAAPHPDHVISAASSNGPLCDFSQNHKNELHFRLLFPEHPVFTRTARAAETPRCTLTARGSYQGCPTSKALGSGRWPASTIPRPFRSDPRLCLAESRAD